MRTQAPALRLLVIVDMFLVLTMGLLPAQTETLPGDLDQSGTVDAADEVILRDYLAGNLQVLPAPAGILPGDLDQSGTVDAADEAILWNFLAGNLEVIPAWSGALYQVDPLAGNLRCVLAGAFTQGRLPDDPCDNLDDTPFTHFLTKHLAVMETEVTRGMWDALRAADPSGFPLANPGYFSGSSLPVERVTWYEAVLFANRLSVLRGLTPCYYIDAGFATPVDKDNYNTTGQTYFCDWNANGFRLPSEGEWEYFCRAGTVKPFSVAELQFTSCYSEYPAGALPGLESVAWFRANSGTVAFPDGQTHPAGQKNANPLGLKDVHGNVNEWCWDWYGTYPSGSATDHRGAGSGSFRVRRGGDWYGYARYCRSAHRYGYSPGFRSNLVGFRLLRPLN